MLEWLLQAFVGPSGDSVLSMHEVGDEGHGPTGFTRIAWAAVWAKDYL